MYERVDISAGIQASLAGRYASALFELASENGTVTAVETDLQNLAAALSESDELASVTTNPQLSRAEQGSAVSAVASHLGLSDLTTKFLGVLAANRRLRALALGKSPEPEICQARATAPAGLTLRNGDTPGRFSAD